MRVWPRGFFGDSGAYTAFQKSVEVHRIGYGCLQDAELKLGERYSTVAVACTLPEPSATQGERTAGELAAEMAEPAAASPGGARHRTPPPQT